MEYAATIYKNGITNRDFIALHKIVDRYFDKVPTEEIQDYVPNSIKKIKPAHYLVLGLLIGERVATCEAAQKLKSILIWQNQN